MFKVSITSTQAHAQLNRMTLKFRRHCKGRSCDGEADFEMNTSAKMVELALWIVTPQSFQHIRTIRRKWDIEQFIGEKSPGQIFFVCSWSPFLVTANSPVVRPGGTPEPRSCHLVKHHLPAAGELKAGEKNAWFYLKIYTTFMVTMCYVFSPTWFQQIPSSRGLSETFYKGLCISSNTDHMKPCY